MGIWNTLLSFTFSKSTVFFFSRCFSSTVEFQKMEEIFRQQQQGQRKQQELQEFAQKREAKMQVFWYFFWCCFFLKKCLFFQATVSRIWRHEWAISNYFFSFLTFLCEGVKVQALENRLKDLGDLEQRVVAMEREHLTTLAAQNAVIKTLEKRLDAASLLHWATQIENQNKEFFFIQQNLSAYLGPRGFASSNWVFSSSKSFNFFCCFSKSIS